MQSVGNYDLVRKIAERGMCTVYQGRHKQSGLIVAIKTLPPTAARNPVLLKRFEQEFRATSALDHPGIVKSIEYYRTVAAPFLVMEFIEGESIGNLVKRDGRMREEFALAVMIQICRGLHHAHQQGLIHRNVKPDSILITPDGIAKLTDFGLARDVESELNLTRTGRGLGTPHFMAPEQFRDAKNADIRSDIYSLGATLYAMLTGQLPFGDCDPLDCWIRKTRNDFREPREWASDISERAARTIDRAMSAEPKNRPASCREFIDDLTGVSIGGQSQDTLVVIVDPVIDMTMTSNFRDGRPSRRNKLVGAAPETATPSEHAEQPEKRPDSLNSPDDVPEFDWFVWVMIVMMGVATGVLGFLFVWQN